MVITLALPEELFRIYSLPGRFLQDVILAQLERFKHDPPLTSHQGSDKLCTDGGLAGPSPSGG